MEIYKGEKIRLMAEFSDKVTKAPADPSTPVTISIQMPDGTTVETNTATQVSTGKFEYLFTATATGVHRYKFVTSDNAVEQDSFEVKEIF